MTAVPKARRFSDPKFSDPKAVKEARRRLFATGKWCQICGRSDLAIHAHHIRSRGAGGADTPENLVWVCAECHTRIHAARLEPVARRTSALPPLEELLQLFTDTVEAGDDLRWLQGAVILLLLEGFGLKPRDVSSLTGWSPAQVREAARTFAAFPEESTRIPGLSWYHHRLASRTDDPPAWLARASDEGWSTRQMAEAMRAALGGKSEEDARLEKSERIVRMAREVLGRPGPAADYLRAELGRLLGAACA